MWFSMINKRVTFIAIVNILRVVCSSGSSFGGSHGPNLLSLLLFIAHPVIVGGLPVFVFIFVIVFVYSQEE
jgi:hypothetical protein